MAVKKEDDKTTQAPEDWDEGAFDLAFTAAAGGEAVADEGTGTPPDDGKPADEGTPPDDGTPADDGTPPDGGKPADEGTPPDDGEPTKVEKTPEEKAAEAKEAAEAKVKADADKAAKDVAARQAAEAKKVADDKAEADRKAAAQKAEDERKKDTSPTDEEKKNLEVLEKDWEDIHKAMKANNRLLMAEFKHMLTDHLSKAKQELTTGFDERLAPISSTVAVTAQEKFNTELTGLHPDAFEILPDMEAWINTQPGPLQDAYNKILDGAPVKDTADLITTFKAVTGRTTEKAGGTDGTPTKKETAAAEAKKKADAARKRREQSMEGVSSRDSNLNLDGGVDEDDFEGAFNRAAAR